MKTTLQVLCTVLVTAMVLVSFVGCDMFAEPGEGSLVIQLGDGGRSLWRPQSDDLAIESYKITFTNGPATFTQIHDVTSSNDKNQFIIDGLRAGTYTITIEGYDTNGAGGEKIAELQENEPDNREIVFTIRRAEITEVQAVLVPYVGGTGTLEIDTIEFDGFDVDQRLMQNNPEIIITLRHLGGVSLDGANFNYEGVGDPESFRNIGTVDSGHAVEKSNETLTLTIDASTNSDNGPEDLNELTFSNLPGGWYEVKMDLRLDIVNDADGNNNIDNRYRQDVYFAQIMNTKTTNSGTVTIKASELETGTLDMWVFENMDPMTVTIDSASGTDVSKTGDIITVVDEGTTVTINASAKKFKLPDTHGGNVTTEAVSAGAKYYWYVNGQLALTETVTETGVSSSFESNGTSNGDKIYETPDFDTVFSGNFLGEAGIYDVVLYVLDVAGQGNNAIGVTSVRVEVDQ